MRLALALACMAGCSAPTPESHGKGGAATEPSAFMEALAGYERRTGGRLGVVLIDEAGREALVGYRADEPMAFCSSFKFALAGAALEAAAERRFDPDVPVDYDLTSLPGYSPVLDKSGGRTTLRDAMVAAVTVSDNGAANMLIDAMGGPGAVTDRWRAWGDHTSRLDRRETALNENAPGDPRDTSTPRAMAQTVRALDGDVLAPDDREWLFGLGEAATTGLDRVRAGLPEGWSAGDKTGTCKGEGDPNQQVNDIGWIDHPNGLDRYYFAVMVQRPSVSVAETKRIMAEIGAHLATAIGD